MFIWFGGLFAIVVIKENNYSHHFAFHLEDMTLPVKFDSVC